MKTVTHLNSLRAIEATARLGSYASAAKEIGVTPEAIGQLVRSYEAYLGYKLFRRKVSGVKRLTINQDFSDIILDVRDAFEMLSQSAQSLKNITEKGTLTVSVPPSFASHVLIPNMYLFRDMYPDINLKLDISDDIIDIFNNQSEIAVRYAKSGWKNESDILISNEKVFPVCTPEYFKNHPYLSHPTGLINTTLIHDLTIAGSDFPNWQQWIETFNIDYKEIPSISFNTSTSAIDAVLLNHGVALGREEMVKKQIAAGTLINLHPELYLNTGRSYFVVHANNPTPKLVAFIKWLKSIYELECDG
ncbi:LysR substrate-binding domain-containing protein [Moritella viscosa]|uniref:LysR substrate-binding domain-containing protein n=1 Tax=Moritella viscosa TaxID=80854 RepID=UPI00091F8536|nr:LysR substrate-binding domain-containing protein [Moritella viscosa]SGY89688.1 Transcriptional regulator, LysR family [Moritella viscosa]